VPGAHGRLFPRKPRAVVAVRRENPAGTPAVTAVPRVACRLPNIAGMTTMADDRCAPAASAEAGARTLSAAMAADHARLEELEAAVFAARDAGHYAIARVIGRWLAHGMRRHIRFEDAVVFPEWATRAAGGYDAELVRELREEHVALERLVSHLEQQVGDPDSSVELVRRALRHRLEEHEGREAPVFAILDGLLPAAEKDQMAALVEGWGPI
jgi:hypothetical protein